MTNPLPQTDHKIRRQILKKYRNSTPFSQKIIHLFSVIYEPVSRTVFVNCLNQVCADDPNFKPLVIKTLDPYINKLLTDKLLLVENKIIYECEPLLVEIATRDAIVAGYFPKMVDVVQETISLSSGPNGTLHFRNKNQLMRETRIALYTQDIGLVNKHIDSYPKYNYQTENISLDTILLQICNNPFDQDWFRTLSPAIYETAITSILTNAMIHLSPADEVFDLLSDECLEPGEHCSNYLLLLLIEHLILRNSLEIARKVLEKVTDGADLFRGWLAFLDGDHQQAIAYYRSALKFLRKTSGKQKSYFHSLGGLFFIFALLKDGSMERLQEAEEYINLIISQPKHWLRVSYTFLKSIIHLQMGDISSKKSIINTYINPNLEYNNIEVLLLSLCCYWADIENASQHISRLLEQFYQQSKLGGYHWLSMEAAELMSRLKPESDYQEIAQELRQESSIVTLVDLIKPQAAWELCLNALTNLDKEPQTKVKAQTQQRLVWWINAGKFNDIQPREQIINVKGVWSKGRPIALKRLHSNLSEFNYLTPQDLRVCSYIESYSEGSGYYGRSEYHRLNEKAMIALIGHPLVFWENSPNVRVEIVKGEPELIVKQEKDDYLTLEFSPPVSATSILSILKETPTRVKVIEINAEHRRIGEIIGKDNRLKVPIGAKEKVLAAINSVSGMVTIHSDIGGEMEKAQEVIAETKPHVHLLLAGAGLKISLLVRPFALGGPYYHPAQGGITVVAEIAGQRLQTKRDFDREKKLAEQAIAACPTLARQEEEAGEWVVEEPEECLEILLELQAIEEQIVLEWPEGEKIQISHYAGLKDFRMGIQRQRDWFSATGELKLDDNLILDMQRLMELLEQSPSRFIPLGQGQFLALTQEFRNRLDELRTFSEKHGDGLRFHPLATLALEDMVDEVGQLKADKHWQEHIQRLREMKNLQPQLPSTLQAELRDYQMDGFQWLARLAYWGVGACLADDMGLGKTIQALALILTRAPDGPTLIVAPTSVCINWVSETQKFAPTLNIVQFGSGDSQHRQAVLDQLQPFDLVVCSYGLLQQEEVALMLAQISWQTIVLDEAQSIKNFATKRSQAAMSLQAGFKLITTGTPIENHLGELWNLFRFINPGLLSSLENFNQRFANPIEKFQDKKARQKLKKLIQPFLLRRTKNQVLQELPSRTEITLHVDLSQEEIALYEALRQQAIAKLTDSEAQSGQKHLQVLVEIMKLRRACCHPALVMPDASLKSAKLQLFGEVLCEILENKHKALVFSQFVDHLHIIRDYLDQQKISYHYLDGSTPSPERKKRVDAFQSGSGDVFLISLKAGGTGLNLTAADYVIHMDPWWNPAVEDQASDRAHRIGQKRPVTIYRLVAKNTIEEKIVDLHQQKRDLADSLLENADVSGKISTEALLKLIYES